MARIKFEDKTTTSLYQELEEEKRKAGEKNDCSVIAIAAATGRPYEEARQALAAQGRVHRGGSSSIEIQRALKSMGFKILSGIENWDLYVKFLSSLPGHHQSLKNITTHHPKRFAEQWAKIPEFQNCILLTRNHAVGICDGVVHDWSKGRSLRVELIITIEKEN